MADASADGSVGTPDGTEPAASDGAGETAEDDTYGGVLTAFPYAFRASGSRTFRSYVVVGTLLALLVAIGFLSALVVLMSSENTGGVGGGTFTFARPFFILVGLLVVVPLIAPILLVARRHRRQGSTVTYDRAMALSGYLFALSVYLLLVITAPPAYRDEPAGALAPVIEFLYGLPPIAGLVPPIAASVLLWAVHRRLR